MYNHNHENLLTKNIRHLIFLYPDITFAAKFRLRLAKHRRDPRFQFRRSIYGPANVWPDITWPDRYGNFHKFKKAKINPGAANSGTGAWTNLFA